VRVRNGDGQWNSVGTPTPGKDGHFSAILLKAPDSAGRDGLAIGSTARNGLQKERRVQVLVRDNNVDQALKALKKKMQREGIFREMKLRGHYEKPSEKKAREKAEAVRRARKLARKRAQREGLIPVKAKAAPTGPGGGRGGQGRSFGGGGGFGRG
jgi:small subunit ribosomal protein S21